MADNFSQQAALYVKYRPRYPKEMYDFIFRHVQQRDKAWDCGTGSGQVAGYLAEHFKEVFASDTSREQLKYAPKKENITYKNVPAEETGFPADCFDLATVAQAIHWFDFDRFYSEVNRTAKNGALLAVIGYGIIRVDEKINQLVDNFYNYAFGKYFNNNRRYVDERYQTIPFPFDEIESSEFSISYRWDIKELEGYFNSWSTVQKFKDRDGFNPVDNFLEELKTETEWIPGQEKEVTFPVFVRLGRIRK